MIPHLKRSLPIFSLALILPFAIPAFAAPQNGDGSAKNGAVLFRDKGCTYCHGPAGQGAKKGPSLLDVWKDKTLTNEKITKQILNGGQKMPPFADSVSDEEVADLIAWLRAKNKPVPPPAEADTSPAVPPQ